MRTLLFMAALLGASAASAQKFPGGGGRGAVTVTDVQAALAGQAISASTYTATATSGTAFQCTGDAATCLRVGTPPRATIGLCEEGAPDICFGPNDFGFTSKARLWGDFTAQTFVARTLIDIQGPGSYIINNNGAVNVNDTDGMVINSTTPLKGRVALAVTFDSPSINAGTCLDQNVTVTGALVGDFVTSANADFALVANVSVGNARVTATDTIELRLCNSDLLLPRDPASGSYKFVLER